MSGRHVLLILFILLLAVLAVGLVLCRPMTAENYADGAFSFDAVNEVYVWAYEEQGDGAPVTAVAVTDERTVKALTGFFDGKGFGRTPASLFSDKEAQADIGDRCWGMTFRNTVAGSSLTAMYRGGALTLTGSETVTVAAQDKSQWAEGIYDYIITLYPEPEPDPEPEVPEETEE